MIKAEACAKNLKAEHDGPRPLGMDHLIFPSFFFVPLSLRGFVFAFGL